MTPPRRPDPEPMETDDVRVIAIGTALWLVALVLALVFHDRLAAHDNSDWVWIALAGVFLGLVGLRYVRRRQSAMRSEQQSPRGSDATHDPEDPHDHDGPDD